MVQNWLGANDREYGRLLSEYAQTAKQQLIEPEANIREYIDGGVGGGKLGQIN